MAAASQRFHERAAASLKRVRETTAVPSAIGDDDPNERPLAPSSLVPLLAPLPDDLVAKEVLARLDLAALVAMRRLNKAMRSVCADPLDRVTRRLVAALPACRIDVAEAIRRRKPKPVDHPEHIEYDPACHPIDTPLSLDGVHRAARIDKPLLLYSTGALPPSYVVARCLPGVHWSADSAARRYASVHYAACICGSPACHCRQQAARLARPPPSPGCCSRCERPTTGCACVTCLAMGYCDCDQQPYLALEQVHVVCVMLDSLERHRYGLYDAAPVDQDGWHRHHWLRLVRALRRLCRKATASFHRRKRVAHVAELSRLVHLLWFETDRSFVRIVERALAREVARDRSVIYAPRGTKKISRR